MRLILIYFCFWVFGNTNSRQIGVSSISKLILNCQFNWIYRQKQIKNKKHFSVLRWWISTDRRMYWIVAKWMLSHPSTEWTQNSSKLPVIWFSSGIRPENANQIKNRDFLQFNFMQFCIFRAQKKTTTKWWVNDCARDYIFTILALVFFARNRSSLVFNVHFALNVIDKFKDANCMNSQLNHHNYWNSQLFQRCHSLDWAQQLHLRPICAYNVKQCWMICCSCLAMSFFFDLKNKENEKYILIFVHFWITLTIKCHSRQSQRLKRNRFLNATEKKTTRALAWHFPLCAWQM